MALAEFADLKLAVSAWLTRSDMGGMAEDFISLAEARLNRELNPVETSDTLTGVVGNREIDVTAQQVEETISLFVTDPDDGDEREVLPKTAGTFSFVDDEGRPSFWSFDNDTIVFERPLDKAYSFRFRFTQRFNLSDDAPTNWLLTHHPDIYLAATLIWGTILKRSADEAVPYIAVLKDGIPSVRRTIARSKRAVLSVDPALIAINRRSVGYWS